MPNLVEALAHDPRHPLLFHTGTFAALFAVFVAVHAMLAGRSRARLAWLLAFSMFYYWRSNGVYALVLVALATVDWALALRLDKEARPRVRRVLLAASVASNLVGLGYFKYTNLLGATVAALAGRAYSPLDIFLPLGISFHVFQSLSYLVDVYRRRYAPTNSLFEYVLFLSFFPQLVAGPIVRAPHFFSAIHPLRTPRRAEVASALARILRGVVKKAILADHLGLYSDLIFGAPKTYSGPEVLLAVYAYTLQIYFDFSGYSDMALGMARMIGVRIPENFDAPYTARSITDFWRRWHVSLSSWLREYLYVSLGGNRHGRVRQGAALLATMLLGGLWHGASWTFVAWGGIHGVALIADKWIDGALARRWPSRRPSAVVGWLVTLHFVAFTWVLFRAPTFDVAIDVLARLPSGWTVTPLAELVEARAGVVTAVVVGAIACATPASVAAEIERRAAALSIAAKSGAFALVVVAVTALSSVEVRPFLYFQF